jgi:CPA2 family monovalent cation:H+ antiporter-2
MQSTPHELSLLLIELGLVVLLLAVLARVASRWNFAAIPFYLLAGLAFGNGGLVPLELTSGSVHLGAEIGVLLLLFMLGLEYTGEQLMESLRSGLPTGLVDLALNFPPGLIAGLLLGWKPLSALLLGSFLHLFFRRNCQIDGRASAPEMPGDPGGACGVGP